MKQYKATLRPKEGMEPDEDNISLDHLEMTFTIGANMKLTAEQHMVEVFKSWHLYHFMDFELHAVEPETIAEPVADVQSQPRTAAIPGTYRIRYRKPGGRIELESQMRLFSRDHNPLDGYVLLFSARPRFGTTVFKESDIISMYRVADNALIYVNHDPRKGEPREVWRYER